MASTESSMESHQRERSGGSTGSARSTNAHLVTIPPPPLPRSALVASAAEPRLGTDQSTSTLVSLGLDEIALQMQPPQEHRVPSAIFRDSLENIPLGMIHYTSGVQVGDDPPLYTPSRPPPAYRQGYKEYNVESRNILSAGRNASNGPNAAADQQDEVKARLKRRGSMALTLLTIDSILILALLFSTVEVVVNRAASSLTILIPLAYLLITLTSRAAYIHTRVSLMRSHNFVYLLRCIIDIVGALKKSYDWQHNGYWSVEPMRVSMLFGVAGTGLFVGDLFPCSIKEYDDVAVEPGTVCLDPLIVYPGFIAMWLPRFSILIFLFWYTKLCAREEKRQERERRRRTARTVANAESYILPRDHIWDDVAPVSLPRNRYG